MSYLVTDPPAVLSDTANRTPQLFLDTLRGLAASFIENLPHLLAAVLVLVAFWLLGRVVQRVVRFTTRRSGVDERIRILTGRLIGIGAVTVGIFAAFTVIIPSLRFSDIIAGLGFTSFIVGFATRDILNNLLSGVLILWKQPFQIGDHIVVKDKQGKVEYIGVRATTMRMDDGERVLVPNGDMYSSALTVRNSGDPRRMKVLVTVGYDADIGKAKAILAEVLGKSDDVKPAPAPQILVTDLTADGVRVAVYFWIDSENSRPLQVFDAVATAMLGSLREARIGIFPSTAATDDAAHAKEERQPQPPVVPKEDL
jgi:small-conductance mechanosensitive channel